jgi:hypothetical protein
LGEIKCKKSVRKLRFRDFREIWSTAGRTFVMGANGNTRTRVRHSDSKNVLVKDGTECTICSLVSISFRRDYTGCVVKGALETAEGNTRDP